MPIVYLDKQFGMRGDEGLAAFHVVVVSPARDDNVQLIWLRDASTGRENDVTGAIFHGPIIELQRGRKAPHEYHGPVAGLGGGGDDEEGDV